MTLLWVVTGRRRRENAGAVAPLFVRFFPSFSQAFEGPRAFEKVWGWGRLSERRARERAAANLARDPETARPFVRVRTPPSTLPPLLLVGPLRAPDLMLCARALPPFSLPRVWRQQPREVLLVFASHWLGALPFFPAFRLSQNKRDLHKVPWVSRPFSSSLNSFSCCGLPVGLGLIFVMLLRFRLLFCVSNRLQPLPLVLGVAEKFIRC